MTRLAILGGVLALSATAFAQPSSEDEMRMFRPPHKFDTLLERVEHAARG